PSGPEGVFVLALTAENTLLVASVAPASNAEALAARSALGDLPPTAAVELRLDGFVEAPAFSALRACFEGRKLIATVRSKAEGGVLPRTEEEERRFLEGALAAGFDLADVEFRRDVGDRFARIPPSKKISSLHDLEGIPADLNTVATRMLSSGARYVKVVATANDSGDARRLLELQAAHREGRLATFGMGEAGICTRALAPYLGAALAYGSLLPGRGTAPGQVLALDLAETYGVGRPRKVSRLFGLFGVVVSHSLSPALHNANFEAFDLDALYAPFAMLMLGKELESLVASLDGLGLPLLGASVTIPFKEEAALLSEAGEGGERAVNTLLRTSAPGHALRMRGKNTDRDAFEAVIEEASKEKKNEKGDARIALVLGAGGTARVAVDVLRKRGWDVFISNRTDAHGEELARAEGAHYLSKKSPVSFREASILVNATPLGLREGDPLPCEQSLLRPGMLVIDAPYRAEGTELVRVARAAGARVVDGQTLLLLQAAGQATLFTGKRTTARELLARLPSRVRASFSFFEDALHALPEISA
ncbi:MAG TPA: type I 3-dehydroquinate dehydratase, partial [Thermoanaerobaculia bacterium]|nr:type I 3-dehydroquinate dehydratase [Thermoanaerobaculia bacterium]